MIAIRLIVIIAILCATPGFHNFNLRIFNLRVSNPHKLMVDVFLTRCRISMCQGLGRKNKRGILKTDHSNSNNSYVINSNAYLIDALLLIDRCILDRCITSNACLIDA